MIIINTPKTNYSKFYYPQESNGICVVRRKDESVEDLIKRFRKKFSKSGIMKEFKDKMYFEKPSEKKRRKRAAAIRAARREEQKQEEMRERFAKMKQQRQRQAAKRNRSERNSK